MTNQQKKIAAILFSVTAGIISFVLIGTAVRPFKASRLEQAAKTSQQKKSVKDKIRAPASVASKDLKSLKNDTKKGPSPLWKKQVEKALFVQANGTLRKVEIETMDSFDWKVGQVDVRVDSVIVKLEHVKGFKSTFRALIDSDSGKILQTWDLPVIDNFSPERGIAVDSRYHDK